MQEQNFASSGEPKIACSERPSTASTVRVHRSSLEPRSGCARYARASASEPMTLYRIHGTNEPSTIGQSVSSGCIRMLNQDVIDLYARTPVGAKVVVLASGGQAASPVSAAASTTGMSPQPAGIRPRR